MLPYRVKQGKPIMLSRSEEIKPIYEHCLF